MWIILLSVVFVTAVVVVGEMKRKKAGVEAPVDVRGMMLAAWVFDKMQLIRRLVDSRERKCVMELPDEPAENWWEYIKSHFFHKVGTVLLKIPRPLKVVGEYGGIMVVLDTPALWREWHIGVPCAMAYENGWTGNPTIAVNRKALRLPTKVFEALMAHEAGHIELGHLKEEWIPAHEFEADRWALEVHGWQYLYAMQHLTEWHGGEFITERIKTIKRLHRFMCA